MDSIARATAIRKGSSSASSKCVGGILAHSEKNGSASDLDLDILIIKTFHKVGDGGFFDP